MIALLLATSLLTSPADTTRINRHNAVSPQSALLLPQTPPSRGLPFGDDKLQHFFMTFAVYNFSYAGTRALGADRSDALLSAAITALVAGVGKEVFDQTHHKRFSGYDLIADALGATVAYGLMKQAR